MTPFSNCSGSIIQENGLKNVRQFSTKLKTICPPSNFGTTYSWEALYFVFDYPWEDNGLHIRPTWQDWKKRARHLLPKQKVHRVRVQIPLDGKDVLCTSLDRSKTHAILDIPYYVVDFQIRSHQVYFSEAITLRENCKMASPIVRIWHSICISKSNQRKCHCRILGR